jgi:hypothetical protein
MLFSGETDKKAANFVTWAGCARIMGGFAAHPSGLIVLRYAHPVNGFLSFLFFRFFF